MLPAEISTSKVVVIFKERELDSSDLFYACDQIRDYTIIYLCTELHKIKDV